MSVSIAFPKAPSARGSGGDRAPRGRGAGPRPPSRRFAYIGAVVALLVAVAALVRFATADTSSSPDAAIPAASAAPADRAAALEAAVEADPEDLGSWQELGRVYLRRAYETGDPTYYDLADRALQRAEALAPGDITTTVAEGALALALHQFDEALALGRVATEEDPFSDEALVVTVDALVELGRYDEAGDVLQQLVELKPNLAALARVSYFRQLHGDTSGAILAMQSAEEAGQGVAFDQATAATFLGDLRFGAGDLDGARAAYERALELAPGLVLAELGESRLLAASGDRAGAIGALATLVDRYPLPAALTLLGELQELDGRAEDAELSYEIARASHGSFTAAGGEADLELALFEADHGDASVAVELAGAAYDERQTIYTADALAWSLYRAGSPDKAREYVDEALTLDTEDALLRYHAAEILAATGEGVRAAAELALAYDLNPWFSPIHEARAAALAAVLGVAVPS